MRKLFNVLILATALMFSAGCGTTPAYKAVQANGVIIYGVDSSMQAWKDYVTSGKATQDQVIAVKNAYNKYYDAQQINKAALEKWIASQTPADQTAAQIASASVENAKASLVNLISSFIK